MGGARVDQSRRIDFVPLEDENSSATCPCEAPTVNKFCQLALMVFIG
jgi:hypothetical protein